MLEIQIDEVEIWESKKVNQANTEFQLRISSWVGRDTCGKNSEEQGSGGVIWRSKSSWVQHLVWKDLRLTD